MFLNTFFKVQSFAKSQFKKLNLAIRISLMIFESVNKLNDLNCEY
jgi:hypothetical protein